MSVRKKLPYILIPLASLAIIAVAALTANRYPDTAEFPRIPMGSGTVGEAIAKILGVSTLENYNGDGTVENTEKFDGRTATGYLRSNPICPASQVWLGIEANGTPKCGTKSSTPLAYAQITDLSGNGTVYRTDGTSVPLVNNMQLYAGDIVKTNPSSNTTLTFPDSSLLRLDSDTTVSFDLVFVQPSNQTMASAILASGQLWGRILTQSGSYAIGTDDLVAGVRGTSIALQKTAASNITNDAGIWKVTSSESPTALTVVDSKIPTGQ